jgi:hypothetical protein
MQSVFHNHNFPFMFLDNTDNQWRNVKFLGKVIVKLHKIKYTNKVSIKYTLI